MSGFPVRPNRTAFGGDYVDERPVEDTEKEISASIFNLSFWQLAGLGRVIPKAVLVCSVAGGVVTTDYQLLVFDPNGSLSTLTWTYNGVGDYSLAFASQYPDENGTNQNLSLVGALAGVMDSTPVISSVDLTSGYEADVYFLDDAGAAADPAGFVVVFW